MSTAIDSTTATTSSLTAATTSAKELSDRFLKLLVAQMNNQDPLNPLDNAEVTSQMAQINTVTGINNLTDTVTSLLDQFAQMQSLQAAQLTGRNVLVEGNDLTLGESGAVGGIELESAADAVKVEIYDANGTLVRTLDLGAEEAGDFGFTWDGKDDAGQALDAGTYTFKVAATNSGKEVDATALAIRTVDGVRRDGTTLQLLLAGHGSVAYSDIKLIV